MTETEREIQAKGKRHLNNLGFFSGICFSMCIGGFAIAVIDIFIEWPSSYSDIAAYLVVLGFIGLLILRTYINKALSQ